MNSTSFKILILLFCFKSGLGQSPAFYHLSIDNGLSDNHVRSLAINQQGFLWIGTEEGLNLYNGHSFTVYLKEKYPGMPSDYITNLFCDSSSRLWIGAAEGAAMFGNKQQFSRVLLKDTVSKFTTRSFFQTATKGIILISNLGHFALNEKNGKWEELKLIPAQLSPKNIRKATWLESDKVLLATDSIIYLYDYATDVFVEQYPVGQVSAMCKVSGNRFAFIRQTGQVVVMNSNGRIERQYQLASNFPTDIKMAANGDLVIAAGMNGIVVIDTKGTITTHVHNPIIPTSIISNSAYRLATGNNGEVVIGTSTSGLSIYNTNLSQAGFQSFFKDERGHFYDNYTGAMVQDGDVVWIGAYDRLIKWNRKTNNSIFYTHLSAEQRPYVINTVFRDKKGLIWVGLGGKGVAWFSPQTGRFTELKADTSLAPVFKSKQVLHIWQDKAGLLWVCTAKGIFKVDPASKKALLPADDQLNKTLNGKIVHSFFTDIKEQKWFSTIGNGIYCFDKAGNELAHFTEKNGLPSDICYMVQADTKGRYYVVTAKGIAVLNEKIIFQTLTKENGLRYERCESVVIDNDGIAWFSNKKCLVRFDADKNSTEFFDEKAGLLNNGFRVAAYLKTTTGELLWGGYRGISYFYPSALKNYTLPLRVSIYRLTLQDSVMDISSSSQFKTLYKNNSVNFSFAATHLGISGKTFYQYRLTGFNKEWQKIEDIGQARYSALAPGNYVFEVKASIDGVKWEQAPQKITITVIPPLWMRWWFIALMLLLLLALAWWFARSRNKKIRQQQEDLETEKAINYFANSLHEQQTVETILWDVARNCISRLSFEDCIIYLVDEKRNVLVQKAAYGPKSHEDFQITAPLEIPVGKGITGTVAATAVAEIIPDTTKDIRYITDDRFRLSEIAVPIVWGSKVIGVIDCEHHKKNYFTKKHLSILNTIASLCANKIIRARAEEEKRQAQLILTDTQQKMAEVEMKALRAQMNPHFIFNCLNSINRYIVKSDQVTASRYLTRFSKLIRLILDNSASKNVSLSNELEALKLYIEMEALRFDKKFTYEISIDKNVNADSIEVPPLIIQPYVENAIWHGLLHKNGGGQLMISIKMKEENMLECVVEDNGVGRKKSAELKSKSATSRKSLGMQLTQHRLSLLNRQAQTNASVAIVDLTNNLQEPAGTKVILLIPV